MNKKSIFRPSYTSPTPSIMAALAVLILAGCAIFSTPAMAAPATMMSLGTPASARSAIVMIRIDPSISHVNINDGTTVNFVVGTNTFAWRFDVPHNVSLFDLSRIAPPSTLDHQVEVYVAPSMLSIF